MFSLELFYFGSTKDTPASLKKRHRYHRTAFLHILLGSVLWHIDQSHTYVNLYWNLKYLQWSGKICPLSNEIYQTLFPVSVFYFQACSEPFHWIKDQMRRLSSDHLNSHLAFGVCEEQKLLALFFLFFLSPSLSEKCTWSKMLPKAIFELH